jgi:hypothetical protein
MNPLFGVVELDEIECVGPDEASAIWAETPLLVKPERNRVPPMIAETTMTSPRIEGLWTLFGFDFREKVNTITERARITMPMNT